ncbi:hypothetical protein [Enterococcus sp.]|uniref:hypothetical protein n=1 Tax=Enterococcus sp. TaxID=35783 RepID=UPI002FC6C34E
MKLDQRNAKCSGELFGIKEELYEMVPQISYNLAFMPPKVHWRNKSAIIPVYRFAPSENPIIPLPAKKSQKADF